MGRVLLWWCALLGPMWATATAATGSHSPEWVASWMTPISGNLSDESASPAMPHGEAFNQSFRLIIQPDLWGEVVRLRFSNAFGDRPIRIGAATIGLQESAGVVAPGTLSAVSFGGHRALTLPGGAQVLSDPVRLRFVSTTTRRWLRGRRLAVSLFIDGASGPLSAHLAAVTSYVTRSDGGDHTAEPADRAYPLVTRSFVLLNELDVLADSGTSVVCVVGDSITDGATITTVDGYDGWPDMLARRLHAAYADKVSVVNAGIRGNTVIANYTRTKSQPLLERLDRDVLSVAGLTTVLLLEGINDLGGAGASAQTVIEGYRKVADRLHARGVRLVAGTVQSSRWPLPDYDTVPNVNLESFRRYGDANTNTQRLELNDFIHTSSIFDGVVPLAEATADPVTGALYAQFQSGDYLHPNRAGRQAMADAVNLSLLVPSYSRSSKQ